MTYQSSPEFRALCMDIEKAVGRKIQTPYDFDFLVTCLWEHNRCIISTSTLKRLWGYIPSTMSPRRSTLDLLSRFIGYKDWNDYIQDMEKRLEVQSNSFTGKGIHATDLQIGDCIEVTWLPNRRCIFRYLGEHHFIVEYAEHSKLREGDTFDAVMFSVCHPMYLDHLSRDNMPSTSYVAGKKNGLITVRKIQL